MTVTRTQAGKTPRKTQHPGYVETPGRKFRPRTSGTDTDTDTVHRDRSETSDTTTDDTNDVALEKSSRRKKTSSTTNGNVPNGKPAPVPRVIDGWKEGTDPRIDNSGHFEFGGSWGVSAMMIGFPMLMYYMWIGATYYEGRFPTPLDHEPWTSFLGRMGLIIYTGAFPSAKAWAMYWTFFLFEAACYMLLPGIHVQGRPLSHAGGQQLTYYCSAMWSLYTTLAIAAILHVSGLFKIYNIIDEFGPLMSVAIISGFLVSIIAYISATVRGATHRMTGYPLYDFFMGAELNPRMFGLLDFKMFFEVRLPWYILLLVTLGTAARQYEEHGYVSGEVAFLCMAHFLYANACSKAEECIVPTWDMYYEKWGFMLIFWNLAGVPLSYCHCTIFLANHDPSVYRWNRFALTGFFALYLFVYWIWDTSNSQKNRFKAELTGHDVDRKSFPQLPWRRVENPQTIASENGDLVFVDGWYRYARKIHYTCDLFFALSWGLVTGFRSPFPWFYPVFFACMITHRAVRDVQRCRRKYGKAWEEFERRVPYLFIPRSPTQTFRAFTDREEEGAEKEEYIDEPRIGSEGIPA